MPRRERLRDAGLSILDETTPDAELRAAVFALVHRDVFADAVERVSRLGPARGRYLHGAEEEPGQVAPRSCSGSRGLEIEAAPAGRALLDAALHLRAVQGGGKRPGPPPTAFAPKGWIAQLRAADGRLDLPGYRLAVLDGLRRAIRRRDVFPVRSLRYADPRKGLLTGAAWEAARPAVCRTLGVSPSADEEIGRLSTRLDLARAARRPSAHRPIHP